MAQDGTPLHRPSMEELRQTIVEGKVPDLILYIATAEMAKTQKLKDGEVTDFGLSREDGQLILATIESLLQEPKGTFDIQTMHRIFGVVDTFRTFRR